ncbi:MAG: ABC transporter permease [Planctomycetota bacterium]
MALASHVERVGLNALPIVGLLSFLIGVVLSYQGADRSHGRHCAIDHREQ